MGHLAVQIAQARGADVYATGSKDGLAIIEGYGATAIDYTSTTPAEYVEKFTAGEGFDVIFDTIGGATLDAAFASVRVYTGHVVSILGWGTHALAPLSFRGATYSGVFTLLPLITGRGREHHGEILQQIRHPRRHSWPRATSGSPPLRPRLGRRGPLGRRNGHRPREGRRRHPADTVGPPILRRASSGSCFMCKR